MRYLQAILIALLPVSLASGQQWKRTYGGVWSEYARSGQQTSDGGYIAAGYTETFGAGLTDFYLVRTNSMGETLWTRTYGDTGYQSAYSVRQTSDGGYVMTGVTMPPHETDFDVLIVKTDSSGNQLWSRTYAWPRDDQGFCVRQTSDGGYIVSGVTRSFNAGTNDILLIKTIASGDSEWVRTIGGNGYDFGYSILQTSDGGYVIGGFTSGIGGYGENVYLVKTSPSGDSIWSRTYGGTGDDEGLCVAQTSDSGFILTGLTHPPGGSIDLNLVRTDASGESLWARSYGRPYHDVGNSVRQTSDGGFIITGTSYYAVGDADLWLVRTNAAGETLWTRTFGGGGTEGGSAVQPTLDGGYFVAGHTTSSGAGNGDFWLIKTDANGNAAAEEPGGRLPTARVLNAIPNPFVAEARIPGHETGKFQLYDAAGKLLGICPGNRIGAGLPPAVYFVRLPGEPAQNLRVVKAK